MFKTLFKALDKNPQVQEEDINKIPSFIFCKWLGNNPYSIQAANQINQYYNIPMVNQFHMINKAFGGKKIYIKYPKNAQKDSEHTELLQKHYKISADKAREYKKLLSSEQINSIIKMYERH